MIDNRFLDENNIAYKHFKEREQKLRNKIKKEWENRKTDFEKAQAREKAALKKEIGELNAKLAVSNKESEARAYKSRLLKLINRVSELNSQTKLVFEYEVPPMPDFIERLN